MSGIRRLGYKTYLRHGARQGNLGNIPRQTVARRQNANARNNQDGQRRQLHVPEMAPDGIAAPIFEDDDELLSDQSTTVDEDSLSSEGSSEGTSVLNAPLDNELPSEEAELSSGTSDDELAIGSSEDDELAIGSYEDDELAIGSSEDDEVSTGSSEDDEVSTGSSEDAELSTGSSEDGDLFNRPTDYLPQAISPIGFLEADDDHWLNNNQRDDRENNGNFAQGQAHDLAERLRRNKFHETGNELIHPSLTCTKGEALSLIVAYYIRHKLTKVALQDFLTLLNILVPNCVPQTKYFLERYFFSSSCSKAAVHFYCPECDTYLGSQSEEVFICSFCDDAKETNQSALLSLGKYFLVSPLKDQIKDFLENRNLSSLIFLNGRRPQNPEMLSEIYTGDCYKSAKVQSFLSESPYNFTMTFNSDGTKLFESSSISLWSLLCTFNDVPYEQRSEYVVMSTLSCGEGKPPTDAFLRFFVEETRQLHSEGFTWKDADGVERVSKVMFLLCCADAPARCMFANLMQYNGEFGCGHCLHPGVRAQTGRGTMQAFPLVHPIYPERDRESMIVDAEKAVEQGSPVNGVKGPSLLYLIPGFNVGNGLIPDIMHCLFLGVDKHFLNVWKSEPNQPFYVKDLDKRLDSIIKLVRPPDELPRAVRSIVKYGRNWKANEHKGFLLLYSSVALRKLLRPVFYKHWLLLVNASIILHKKEASKEDVEKAELLIYKFVYETEELYELKAVKYNLHLMIHFCRTARMFGLPWAYSAFLFEGVGGLLKKLFHGSKHVTKQIFEHFLAIGRLRDFSRYYIPDSPNPKVRKLYEHLDGKIKLIKYLAPETLGTGSHHQIQEIHLLSLGLKIGFDLPRSCFNFNSFTRCVHEGKIYSTGMYCENLKRDNSIVKLKSGEIVRIKTIIRCFRNCACQVLDEPCAACVVPRNILFGTENINGVFLVGVQLRLKSLPPCIDKFANNINLVGFLKQLDENNGYNGMHRRPVVFAPSDIAYKCLIIPDHSGHRFCIVNDTVFEGS